MKPILNNIFLSNKYPTVLSIQKIYTYAKIIWNINYEIYYLAKNKIIKKLQRNSDL
jgi:hypothetical protein